MTDIAEKIRQALLKTLPGREAHLKMLPPGRELTPAGETRRNLNYSSVMLLLYEEDRRIFACLIKRPQHMKTHPGQIALPGGRIEKGETALYTALRETSEEIGISAEEVQVIGKLSAVYISVSQFVIQPFVGWLNKTPAFTINPHEVVRVIRFPLFEHRNSEEKTEIHTASGKMTVPCIHFEGEVIWGATAMILSEFLDLVNL